MFERLVESLVKNCHTVFRSLTSLKRTCIVSRLTARVFYVLPARINYRRVNLSFHDVSSNCISLEKEHLFVRTVLTVSGCSSACDGSWSAAWHYVLWCCTWLHLSTNYCLNVIWFYTIASALLNICYSWNYPTEKCWLFVYFRWSTYVRYRIWPCLFSTRIIENTSNPVDLPTWIWMINWWSFSEYHTCENIVARTPLMKEMGLWENYTCHGLID